MIDPRNIAEELKGIDTERIKLLYNQKALPFATCVVNLAGGLNMGIIMRAANFFGAKEVLYLGRKHWDRRSAVGTYNYTTVKYLTNLEELMPYKSLYRFIGVENNVEQAKPLAEHRYVPNSLFIFGEEGSGLDKEMLDVCDDVIYIPSKGGATVRSLNVAMAAGIVFHDYVSSVYGEKHV